MIAICVQVRLKSRRCPRKALALLNGTPLIERLTDRVELSGFPVIWCTSTNTQDDPIETLSRWRGIPCVRGSEDDVIDRFIQASRAVGAGTIVRVTGDNPLTDPWLIKALVKKHKQHGASYTVPVGFPRGVRSEVINVNALEQLHSAMPLSDRLKTEYMSDYLKSMDDVLVVKAPEALNRPDLSFTVDTPSELDYVRKIYEDFDEPPNIEGLVEWADMRKEATI